MQLTHKNHTLSKSSCLHLHSATNNLTRDPHSLPLFYAKVMFTETRKCKLYQANT